VKANFILNGRAVVAHGRPGDRLLDVLRRQFALTGTKEGCGEGECGACTILMDGDAVLSCLTPLLQVEGRELLTIEALAESPYGEKFLERFAASGGTQCGACTPGIVLSAAKHLAESDHVDRDSIREALAGNLCRCTGYEAILRAIEDEAARNDRHQLGASLQGKEQGDRS
jgi:aerobic-type carbon monoxide dehydrogenase small subunit (CoxS/CutS family)